MKFRKLHGLGSRFDNGQSSSIIRHMSADNPLSARYAELVFNNKEWSPTVGQTLALINIKMGEELPTDLISSVTKATNPKLVEAENLLVVHNKCEPSIRKATGPITMQAVALNILHSPDDPRFQEDLEARNVTLQLAVATIGLQMLSEI